MNRIRPDLLAGKIEARAHLEAAPADASRPAARLNELLWFLQALSIGPRGIETVAHDLLTRYENRFVSKPMLAAGAPHAGRYSLAQCLKIWRHCWDRIGLDAKLSRYRYGDSRRAYNPADFDDWLLMSFDKNITVESVAAADQDSQADLMAGLERFNFPFFKARCLAAAQYKLETWLREVCTDKSFGFTSPWYCEELIGLLLEYMDHYAAQHLGTLAQTEVTKIIFRKLEFAITQNVPVPIVAARFLINDLRAGVITLQGRRGFCCGF